MYSFLSDEKTVRALLAIIVLTGCIVNYAIYNSLPEGLLAIASLVLGYYFRQSTDEIRAQRSKNDGNEY